MTLDTFNTVVQEQLKICESLLVKKGAEYAPGASKDTATDRLASFKKAAAIQDISPKQALVGMLTKHIVSVYEMCADGKQYPQERWDEKITDSINYMILLKALVTEEGDPK